MRWGTALFAAFVMILFAPSASLAIPVFSHRYGLSCEVCHTTVPHLSAFGADFLRSGFRLPPGFPVRNAFPVGVKANVQYSSASDSNHLPKVIVDELEFLWAASVTSHLSYRIEQYAIDGGVVGRTRDAWVSYTSRPEFANRAAALRATAGQFTLPLPDDPETQRPTLNHYGIFDQSIGSNPFNLFDDRIGLDVAYGRQYGGFDFHALVMKGHDPQSGLPTIGLDRMFVAQEVEASAVFSVYRYDGDRPLGRIDDPFWRQALAASAYAGKAEVDVLVQTGHDSSANGFGRPINSQGGFGQLIWAFAPRFSGVARYDATHDGLAGGQESITSSIVFRLRPNMRLTLEDVSGFHRGSVNAAWLVAY